MAKKKNTAKRSRFLMMIFSLVGKIWRFFAKILGSTTRFVFRSSRELDPAHQRDGVAFLTKCVPISPSN